MFLKNYNANLQNHKDVPIGGKKSCKILFSYNKGGQYYWNVMYHTCNYTGTLTFGLTNDNDVLFAVKKYNFTLGVCDIISCSEKHGCPSAKNINERNASVNKDNFTIYGQDLFELCNGPKNSCVKIEIYDVGDTNRVLGYMYHLSYFWYQIFDKMEYHEVPNMQKILSCMASKIIQEESFKKLFS